MKRSSYKTLTQLLPGDALGRIGKVNDGMRVHLFCMAPSGRRYLDGNQYTDEVTTIDNSAAADPRFSGINWVLQAASRECWRILNQGDTDFGLIAEGATLRLGRLSGDPATKNEIGDWLIYATGTGERVILRPIAGEWLMPADEDGPVLLGRSRNEDDKRTEWILSASG